MMTMRKGFGILLGALAVSVWSGCEQQGGPATSTPVASSSNALTQDEVLATGDVCVATGKHGQHGFTSCATCHNCGGVLQFNASGPAVNPAFPPPSFDATAKTCSSVACHTVPPGTFSYYFPDGDGNPVLNTWSYGGGMQTTPSWYSTGAIGCSACHGNPPRGSTWHSGHHGNTTLGTYNQCELCHPEAVSAVDPTTGLYAATGFNTLTNCGPSGNLPCVSFHANGTVDVTPKFTGACYGCH